MNQEYTPQIYPYSNKTYISFCQTHYSNISQSGFFNTSTPEAFLKQWQENIKVDRGGFICFVENGNLGDWYEKFLLLQNHGESYIHAIQFDVENVEKEKENEAIVVLAINYQGLQDLNAIVSKLPQHQPIPLKQSFVSNYFEINPNLAIFRNPQINVDDQIAIIPEFLELPVFEIIQPKAENNLPTYNTPWSSDLDFYRMLQDLLASYLNKIKIPLNSQKYQIYLERLEEEVKVILQLGCKDYLLIFYCMLKFNDGKHNIGYGRGSVCGSLVAFILKITQIDPIIHKTVFSRFLSLHRKGMPDIDLDMSRETREFYLDIIQNKMGIKVFKIGTVQKLRHLGTINKIEQCPDSNSDNEAHLACELFRRSKKIEEAKVMIENQFKCRIEDFQRSHKCFKEYARIVNKIRLRGTHPSGYILCPKDQNLERVIGCIKEKEKKVSKLPELPEISENEDENDDENYDNDEETNQEEAKKFGFKTLLFTKDSIDRLGYLKMDLLINNSMEILEQVQAQAEIKPITVDQLNLEDDRVWQEMEFSTQWVFQLGTPRGYQNFKQILQNYEKIKVQFPQITRFKLLCMTMAVIRPGGREFLDAVTNGDGQKYQVDDDDLQGKQLDELLQDTMGYLLLQEQIMEFMTRFCNFSLSDVDAFKKQITSRTVDPQKVDQLLKNLKLKIKNGFPKMDQNQIESLVRTVKNSLSYTFSQNHNIPYSLTTYLMAHLKTYHLGHFLAANLNLLIGKGIPKKIKELQKYLQFRGFTYEQFVPFYGMGYEVRCLGKKIQVGLSPLRGISKKQSKEIFLLGFQNFILSQNYTPTQKQDIIQTGFFTELSNNLRLACTIYLDKKTFYGKSIDPKEPMLFTEAILQLQREHPRLFKKARGGLYKIQEDQVLTVLTLILPQFIN